LFLPDRVASAVSIRNFARAGLHLDTEAWTLFKTHVQNLKKGTSTTAHRLFTTQDPATDTTEEVNEPSRKPSATTRRKVRTQGENRLIKRQDGSFFSPDNQKSTIQYLVETKDDICDTFCEAVAPGVGRDECLSTVYKTVLDNLNEIATLTTTVVGGVSRLAPPGGVTEEAILNADAGIEFG